MSKRRPNTLSVETQYTKLLNSLFVIIYWQYMAKQQLLNQESPVSEVLNRYKKELTKNIERQIPVPNFSIISGVKTRSIHFSNNTDVWKTF